VCITEKVAPRLQLPKERGLKPHFESISLPPGNIRPQQGRKIGNQGLASFQEYILINAQDATTRRSNGHQHRTTTTVQQPQTKFSQILQQPQTKFSQILADGSASRIYFQHVPARVSERTRSEDLL